MSELPEPYIPTKSLSILEGLEAAMKRNGERDAIDHHQGFAAPGDIYLGDFLRTAICAFIAGLENDDVDATFEGLDLLIRAEMVVRERERRRP